MSESPATPDAPAPVNPSELLDKLSQSDKSRMMDSLFAQFFADPEPDPMDEIFASQLKHYIAQHFSRALDNGKVWLLAQKIRDFRQLAEVAKESIRAVEQGTPLDRNNLRRKAGLSWSAGL